MRQHTLFTDEDFESLNIASFVSFLLFDIVFMSAIISPAKFGDTSSIDGSETNVQM